MILEVRQLMQGESDTLRIGAIGTSVPEYLAPSLVALRRTHPKTRVTLLDLSPGEQIQMLRRGEIDLALLNLGSELLARDFYTRRLATVPLAVHLSNSHPLAARKQISLVELRDETFITGAESEMPGYRLWITRLCSRLGKFRPSFVGQAESLSEALDWVGAQNAALLLPSFVRQHTAVSVATIPLVEPEATTDLYPSPGNAVAPPAPCAASSKRCARRRRASGRRVWRNSDRWRECHRQQKEASDPPPPPLRHPPVP